MNRGTIVAIAALLAFGFFPHEARAAQPEKGASCYRCVNLFEGRTTRAYCFQAANNSWGDGTTCKLVYFWNDNEDCEFYGGACYYTEVTGRTSGTHHCGEGPAGKTPAESTVHLF